MIHLLHSREYGPVTDGTDNSRPPVAGMDEPLTPSDRRRQLFRRILIIVIPLLIVLGLLGYAATRRSADVVVPRDEVELTVAMIKTVTEAAAFAGKAQPKNLVEVTSPEVGRVAEVLVRSGERVTAGTPIIRLTNPERELAISDRLARIRSDMFNILGRGADLTNAEDSQRKAVLEAEYERIDSVEQLRRREILLELGVVNEANVGPLRERKEFTDRVLAETRRSAASAAPVRSRQRDAIDEQLRALKQDYAAAERQQEAFLVRAPIDGIVLGLNATAGQAIAAGSSLAGIDPQRGFIIVAEIDEFYASKVAVGLRANANTSSGRHPMRVTHVSPDVREGAFRIELEFVGSDPRLRPGETLQGAVAFPTSGRFVSLPVGPYLEQTGGNWLFVFDPSEGSAKRVNVTPGPRSTERIAVLSGLRAGQQVVTSSYRQWDNVTTIRIKE